MVHVTQFLETNKIKQFTLEFLTSAFSNRLICAKVFPNSTDRLFELFKIFSVLVFFFHFHINLHIYVDTCTCLSVCSSEDINHTNLKSSVCCFFEGFSFPPGFVELGACTDMGILPCWPLLWFLSVTVGQDY